jgi:hypothetical protein
VAYRNYWRKDFVVDLRRIDAFRGYIEHVPTAWIDNYTLKTRTRHGHLAEAMLSRFGGRWHAKARRGSSYTWVESIIIEHIRACLGQSDVYSCFPGNPVADGRFEIISGPWSHAEKRHKLLVEAQSRLETKKQSSKSRKKSSKPKYKRPQRPSEVQKSHRTISRCGPLEEHVRRRISKNRMQLPVGMAPLTKSELLRILQPGVGLPPVSCPYCFNVSANTWQQYLNTFF